MQILLFWISSVPYQQEQQKLNQQENYLHCCQSVNLLRVVSKAEWDWKENFMPVLLSDCDSTTLNEAIANSHQSYEWTE